MGREPGREITPAGADRHNALVGEAWSLIEGEIHVEGAGPAARPGWRARRKLRRAERLFRAALAIHPAGWPSMFGLGKICQRLGRSAEELSWFEAALAIRPDNPDLAREASLAAMDLGRAGRAIDHCRAAIAGAPDDPGLVANLALAYLIAGRVAAAREAIGDAILATPDDPISRFVATVIDDVATGRRPPPRSTREIDSP